MRPSICIFTLVLVLCSCTSSKSIQKLPRTIGNQKTIFLRDYFGEDVSGKTLYFVKVNPSKVVVPASASSYVSSVEGISLFVSENQTLHDSNGYSFGSSSVRVPMINASALKPVSVSSKEKSVYVPEVGRVLEKGRSKKDIFVDSSSSLSSYEKKSALLRAIGENCLVWALDDDFSQETAEFLAKKFDEICPKVREIFGHESDEYYSWYSSFQGWEKSPMAEKRVNIVVYDIGGGDFSAKDGVMGYFHSRDYFASAQRLSVQGYAYENEMLCASNEGKYIYLDASFAEEKPLVAVSTLAHEFQHMVSYGVKTISQGISTSAAHEEMMSMLCEDALQSVIGLSDSDSPEARLPFFEARYAEIGLEYRESADGYYDILSYASNYAFGSWLVRNFGGIKLLSCMAKNSLSGFECALSAVNSISTSSYSARELLLLYAKACVLKSAQFSHKNSVSGKYPFKSIDLWNLDKDLPKNTEYVEHGYYSYSGCTLFSPSSRFEIRPYGMTLVKVGKITSSKACVTISTGGKSDEVWELFVE